MEKIDISIIIPTFNRAVLLEKTLTLYGDQTYPLNKCEVVVIDDGSTDDTENVVAGLQKTVPYRLNYIKQENAGPATARNTGIKEAQGDTLLFTGDDIFPKEDLIEQHMITAHKSSNPAVLGLVEWNNDSVITDFMRYIAPNGYQFRYGAIKQTRNCGFRYFYTSNISLRKEWFLDDLFDEEFPFAGIEDTELAYRLEKKGLKIILNKNAVGYHCHPTTVESFKHRMKLTGISAVFLVKKHPELKRIFFPLNYWLARAIASGLKMMTILKIINIKIYWWSQIVSLYIDGYKEGLSEQIDKESNLQCNIRGRTPRTMHSRAESANESQFIEPKLSA